MSRPDKVIPGLVLLSFLTIFQVSFRQLDRNEGAQLARQYCGSCHLMPAPESLPRPIWQLNILPAMGSYLGIRYMGYDPYYKLKPAEVALLKEEHIFPEKPVIDDETWQKIVAYYVENSPAQSPLDSTRRYRSQPLSLFRAQPVALGKTTGSLVTAVAYDSLRRELWVAEPDKLYRWNSTKGLTHNYDLPGTIVDVSFRPNNRLFTEIGTLLPSETAIGSVFSFTGDSLKAILTNSHRPVCSLLVDLNNDGTDELITANYGHRTGSLSLYTRHGSPGDLSETVLLKQPGAIKVYAKDMNNDGRKDIVALFAQNDEAIYIFYQTDNLQFTARKVLQFEPQYGTSDFILLDYNNDGIDDIAVVHGDNADYSYCLKPFHGLRLLLGTKDHQYKEAFFYPLYGATRLQADDFDQDGDIDFAVSAFFPELTYLASESFVFLENTNASRFSFTAHTLGMATPVKSLTLEKADIDHDGDQDLILGQFGYSPVAVPPALQQQWDTVPYKLVVLINQHRP
jgi:hypothetical protein